MSSITLYTAKVCPYAQRVEIALHEAQVDYKEYQIDLENKPEWYAPKVNSANKVPAIAYGGPDVPPENPSPESVKITESLVLLEFISEVFPEANLMPKDPVLRAKVRFFIEVVNSKFIPGNYKFLRGEGHEDLLAAAEAIQKILPDSGRYAIGDHFTTADIAIIPFLIRMKFTASNEMGKYPIGQGGELLKELSSEKYSNFDAYVNRVLDRPSSQATFDGDHLKCFWEKRNPREQR